MNRTTQYLILLCTIFLNGALLARRASAVVTAPAVDPAVKQLAGKYRDIDTLVEKAQRDAQQVQRKAEREVETLKGRMQRGQSRLERRRQEAIRREAEQRAVLEQKTREQAEKLRKQAEDHAVNVIKQAEQQARLLHDKLQAQEAQDRADARPRITSDWQREVVSDFEADTAFIRKVIMEGEASRVERQNFVALFDEQKQWFDATVKKVQFFFDESYKAVMTKKNSLTGLVDAQRQADEIIYDLVSEHHLSLTVRAQLRLLALYEINNHIQNNKTEDLFLSADTIRSLVEKISKEVAPGQREIKIVTEKERISILEQRIAELEMQLSQGMKSADAPQALEQVVVSPASGSFEQKQDAVQAARQEKADRLKQLEGEQVAKIASLQKEKDDEVGAIKKEADDKIAALTHEKNVAAIKIGRQTEREVSRIQERIEQLEKEKVEAVTVAQKAAQMRVQNLKAEHARMVEILQDEQAKAIQKVRQEIDSLKKEKEEASKRVIDQEAELASERLKARQLSNKLGNAQGKVSALTSEVSKLTEQRKIRKIEQEKERADLVSRINRKQREKATMEVELAQVQQHLQVLTTQSQQRLVALTNQVAKRAVTQQDLEVLLEKKARQRAELEVAIAGANENLRQLAGESEQALNAMNKQLAYSQERCHTLHQQLVDKQRESVELEAAVRTMQETNVHVVGQAHRALSERDSLRDRVVHLQHALAALREQKSTHTEQDPALAQRALALAKQTQAEVAELARTLQQQRHELARRQQVFANMEKIQERLASLREMRGQDTLRDVEQGEVLARMADFGDQVLVDYDTVARATKSAQEMHGQVGSLLDQLGADAESVPNKALRDLDGLLTLLAETAHISGEAPVSPSHETIGAPDYAFQDAKQEEEQESPHEPDEHPEQPEPVDDAQEQTDCSVQDDILDVLAGKENSETETETDPEPLMIEDMVAVAPATDDESDESDEQDDEDDSGQEAQEEPDPAELAQAQSDVLDVLAGEDE